MNNIRSIPSPRFHDLHAVVGVGGGRRAGIALLVVMIVFIVLFMVVWQLAFTTKMEERIASVRYGEIEAGMSQQSVALYTLTLLLEDLKEDYDSATTGITAMEGGRTGPGGAGAGGGPSTGNSPANRQPATSRRTPAATPAAAGSTWYDYIRENLFTHNVRTVGNTQVKVRIVDTERCFSLNHLFSYARLAGETPLEGQSDIREEDLEDAVGDAMTDEEVKSRLRDTILKRTRDKFSKLRTNDAAGEDGEPTQEEEELVEDYTPVDEFVEPLPERLEATREMVRRSVLMVLSINENNGFVYSQRYFADAVADAIVNYVLDRRRAEENNRIYLTSELLNLPEVTPELYYGPTVEIPDGESISLGDFILRRDEFGGLIAEYAFGAEYAMGDEAMEEELSSLQEQFGRFADFPELAGSLQANALTRGMTDFPIEYNEEEDYEYVVQEPLPIGLRDVFTTYSTGKININTAPVPVIFGLLLSLSEQDANKVALDIQDYRNRIQSPEGEEGADSVDGAGGTSTDSGRLDPRERQAGITDPSMLDELAGLNELDTSYQDLQTNFFKSLDELHLVDGEEEGPEDLLQKGRSVDRVSSEGDSPFRKVVDDLQKVAVFGSTHFWVELKAKPNGARHIKTSSFVARRDPKKGMLEILLWKDNER